MEFLIPDTDSIVLSLMDKAYYQSFSKRIVNEYAYKMVGDAKWAEDVSHNRSEMLFNELLPDGLESDGNYLFVIKEGDVSIIGDLWLQKRGNELHIVSIYINEDKRGLGIGTKIAKWMEKWAEEKSFDSITLHVFKSNKKAIVFYKKLGFVQYEKGMRKTIKSQVN